MSYDEDAGSGKNRGIATSELTDKVFQRLVILTYELGDLNRDLFYARHFSDERKAHLANAKLSIADLFTQLSLLCRDLDLKEIELRKLGWQHLQERLEELERRGVTPLGL